MRSGCYWRCQRGLRIEDRADYVVYARQPGIQYRSAHLLKGQWHYWQQHSRHAEQACTEHLPGIVFYYINTSLR
jgi:hypothetical protein